MTSTTPTGPCHACGQMQYHTTPDFCGGCGANYCPPQRIPDLIVTRHAGAIDWLCGVYGATYRPGTPDGLCACLHIPDGRGGDYLPRVIAEATADDVRGHHVVGNLPLHLAALCASVTAIEFAGDAPRGKEYTAADMTAAGARLETYRVIAVGEPIPN